MRPEANFGVLEKDYSLPEGKLGFLERVIQTHYEEKNSKCLR